MTLISHRSCLQKLAQITLSDKAFNKSGVTIKHINIRGTEFYIELEIK